MGWPVMHSRSPGLHNYFFRHYALRGTYVPLAIKPKTSSRRCARWYRSASRACNLTIPHKERALAIVDEIDDLAGRIGAISCIVVRPDGSLAAPTTTFTASRANPATAAGLARGRGTGRGYRRRRRRAVRWYVCLDDRGAPRSGGQPDAWRAGGTRAGLRPVGQPIDWDDRHRALEGAAMLVNTTSQGMVWQPPLDLELRALPASAMVADIVYIPLETPLLAAAAARQPARSTASACCCTRRASRGHSGSISIPR
jgi:shikimate dehydrogenase